MIETGDPRVAPSKIAKGATFWRWTVVRHAAPELRACGRNRLWHERRVRVRCVCGAERTAWELDLTRGLSTGCRAPACRRAYDEGVMTKIAERVRDAGNKVSAAADVAPKLKSANELVARLEAEVEAIRALILEGREIVEQTKKRHRRS